MNLRRKADLAAIKAESQLPDPETPMIADAGAGLSHLIARCNEVVSKLATLTDSRTRMPL